MVIGDYLLQLNKCQTDPYFLQNFQCTTMFISAFCKICELKTEPETEPEIVFVFCSVYLLALDNTKRQTLPAPHSRVWIFRTISGSQMGSL